MNNICRRRLDSFEKRAMSNWRKLLDMLEDAKLVAWTCCSKLLQPTPAQQQQAPTPMTIPVRRIQKEGGQVWICADDLSEFLKLPTLLKEKLARAGDSFKLDGLTFVTEQTLHSALVSDVKPIDFKPAYVRRVVLPNVPVEVPLIMGGTAYGQYVWMPSSATPEEYEALLVIESYDGWDLPVNAAFINGKFLPIDQQGLIIDGPKIEREDIVTWCYHPTLELRHRSFSIPITPERGLYNRITVKKALGSLGVKEDE